MNQGGAFDTRVAWVSAAEAVRELGVKRETLYAYVSRGLVRSVPDGRGRLYARDDLERLKARSGARAGHAAVAAGALRWGEPVLETAVGTIDARGPIYRGVVATEVPSFEAACTLLWNTPFVLPVRRDLGVRAATLRAVLAADAAPFDAMWHAATAFATSEPRAESLELARERAGLLVRRLIAAGALGRGPAAVHASLEAETGARAVLLALGGKTTAAAVRAVDTALVLTADHELNVSTFAARVCASAEASLGACLVAALATLSGPKHGRETARVEALVHGLARPELAVREVAERLDRGEQVPGFGHTLYPAGDPRGARLLELAERLAPKQRVVRTLLSLRDAMQLRAREHPTLDLGLVAIAAALGLPAGSALALFACGRLAGWVGHVLEQRAQGHLLRPRARYVGP